jgi:membrane protease YdiL (CAAX protease family)
LIVYEFGVLVLGPQAVRNGADVWLRQLLELIGFGQYFLLPVMTVCILLGWHYTTRGPWRLSGGLFWGMLGECIVLALCLRLILQLQGALLSNLPLASAAVMLDVSDGFRRAIGFLGAGVYEELLFRLILLSSLAWFGRRLGAERRPSTAVAVILSSVTFAVAHYLGPYGEPLAWSEFSFWFSFLFRFLAGVFFSLLFVYRGFGIAAGTHAGYDLLVGIVRF